MIKKISMSTKHLFWIFALATAVLFDQLFWDKPGGINFFIFILLAILGGLIPMWVGRVTIPWTSYLLMLPALLFSAFTFIRAEPMTTVMNGVLALGSLVLFAISLRRGDWFLYDFRDHLLNGLKFALNALIGGILFFIEKDQVDPGTEQTAEAASQPTEPQPKPAAKPGLAFLRGILLALPLLLVFALLLASADPVFGSRLFDLFTWFDPENLGEYLFRLGYILAIAYILLGVYFFGWVRSLESCQKHKDSPPRSLLGTIEAGVILGAVNLLFLSFVIIQFTYLFGGDQNITIEGFTYAEYARRGFFELLAVAIISALLFYALSQVTERKAQAQKWIFTALGLALVILVSVMLLSAYTRLSLYEEAYGFTRLRTFTHIFMIWTGVGLIALAVLEVTRQMKRLPLILILMAMLFGLTINLLNVDGFIVHQNLQRALAPAQAELEEPLDAGYLTELSFDAVPPLAAYYRDENLPGNLHQALSAVLACWLETRDLPKQIPWSSWHYARSAAAAELSDIKESLPDFRYYQSEDPWGWFVEINEVAYPCSSGWD